MGIEKLVVSGLYLSGRLTADCLLKMFSLKELNLSMDPTVDATGSFTRTRTFTGNEDFDNVFMGFVVASNEFKPAKVAGCSFNLTACDQNTECNYMVTQIQNMINTRLASSPVDIPIPEEIQNFVCI